MAGKAHEIKLEDHCLSSASGPVFSCSSSSVRYGDLRTVADCLLSLLLLVLDGHHWLLLGDHGGHEGA